MSLFRLRSIALLSLILLLTGCGLFATKQDQDIIEQGNTKLWQQHKSKIAELTTWQIDGKVGIRSSKDSGSATLFWLQQLDYYDIRLSGPLGRGATRIIGKPGDVTIEIAGQGRFSAATPEELLEQQIGWSLPVSHLVWWVKGLPAPNSQSRITLDAHSRLQKLQQDGWTIDYLEYADKGGYWLPERIKAYNSDLQVTLVAKQWTLRKLGTDISSK